MHDSCVSLPYLMMYVGEDAAKLDLGIVQDIRKQQRRLLTRPPKGPWSKLGRAVGLLIQEAVEDHVCPVDTPGAWSDADLQEMKDKILCSFAHKKDDPGAKRALLDKIRDRIRNVRGWTLGLLKHIRVDGESINEETLRCMFSELHQCIYYIYINVYIHQCIYYICNSNIKRNAHIYIFTNNKLVGGVEYINIYIYNIIV